MNTKAGFSNRSWKSPNKLKASQQIIIRRIGLVAFLVAGVGFTATAQSFYNLDFELASGIPASPGYPSSIPFTQAFPGWTGYCGTYQQTVVQYDYEWLDSAGISLFDSKDTNEPVTGVMRSRYCACLYSGVVLGTQNDYVETWIAQRGVIPPSAASILFNFSPSRSWGYADVRLTFNGIPIPCSVVSGGGTGPSVLGGDVSQFAGQVGELRFTAPNESTPSHPVARSIFLLDNIRFSSQPPPPSAPMIGTSPQSQTADVGTTVDFAVTAGGSAPLTYQWFFNQTNTLQGATNSTLELVNVQLGRAGTYMVVVMNSYGSVASAPATLIVNASPPSIVTPPLSQTTNVGASIDFTVSATGSLPLSYQWLSNASNILGANRMDLSLSDLELSQSGIYAVVVTNAFGAITSAPATLIVYANPPSIVTPPLSQTAYVGASADFAVSALGRLPLIYQWFFNGSSISGADSTELQLTNLQLSQSGAYTAVVTNAYGAVTSSPAILSVIGRPPAILIGPWNRKAVVGGFVDFLVSAEGSLPLSYQWFFNGNAIAGATGSDLHLTNLQLSRSGNYTVVVTNTFGAIRSAPAALNVIRAPNNPVGTVIGWGASNTLSAGLSNVIAISAGGDHDLALKTDGTVVAWGQNTFGQGTVPAGLEDVIAVAAGAYHNVALKADGTVVAWGSNTLASIVPVGLSNVTAITASRDRSMALKSDGTVVAWGDNLLGEGTVPANLNGVTAIADGVDHTLALRFDGGVVAWGNNSYGQSSVPGGLSGVIAIAAGGDNDLALKSDGTVAAWGDNYWGQSTVPAGLSGVIGIAAGADVWNTIETHGLALKSDGTVVAWGCNSSGQASVPPGLAGVIAVSAGACHSLALVAQSPMVLAYPANQTAEVGAIVTLIAQTNRFEPLSFQWFFNGTNALAGGTNPVLQLTDVRPAQAGAYTVVVSNVTGAATSAPAMLSVIAPVERKMNPALSLLGQPGSLLNLEEADGFGPSPNWATLGNVALTNICQWYFDPSTPLPPQRFYRAWQPGPASVVPALDLHLVPALTLTGAVRSAMRVDYINQFGPTDAWVTLATVTLTNTSQLYFDVSAISQPPRLWRIVPVP